MTEGRATTGAGDRHSAWPEEAAANLAREDAEEIARRYRAGYGRAAVLDFVLEGWVDAGVWPQDQMPGRDVAALRRNDSQQGKNRDA